MKKFLFGLFILGLTNLTFSQQLAVLTSNSDAPVKRSKTVKNSDFISAFTKEDMPSRIQKFQKITANYDVTSKPIFEASDPSTYEVVFKEGSNKIVTVYNQEGNILSSEGEFENIRLPYAISKDLSKKYPGWEFNKIHCSINYSENGTTNITYKVRLKNGSNKKTVKINTTDYSM